MVAMAIGLVLMAVIGYAYQSSSQVFRTIEAASRLQEGARFAFEEMGNNVRMAGFAGCAYQNASNAMNNGADWDKDLFGQPLIGYEDSVNTFPTPTGYPAAIRPTVLRGDALTVLRGESPSCPNSTQELVVNNHNAPSAQFDLTGTHCIQPGTVLVVCDFSHAAVFQMTGPTNNNNTAQNIVHNTGTETPGNCSKYLGVPSTANDCSTNQAYTFAAGSRVLTLKSVIYFIRNNPFGEPSLYRQRLAESGGTTTAEELIEGVENMQILYGVDTSATADGAVDSYTTADQVTVVAPGATASEQWKRVLSVRINLLMVTRQDENVTTAAQTYVFNGATITPSDRRLRKTFTSTIAVRNRL